VKLGTHPQDGESEPTGEDKLGTRPKGGESEPTGEDKPGTRPKGGESEPTGEDKPGTRPKGGESEPTGEDKKNHLWIGNSLVPKILFMDGHDLIPLLGSPLPDWSDFIHIAR